MLLSYSLIFEVLGFHVCQQFEQGEKKDVESPPAGQWTGGAAPADQQVRPTEQKTQKEDDGISLGLSS